MYSLTELQLAMLRVLWARGEATVAEVTEALERGLATSTVATVLGRLEKRGLVAHRSEGRQYVYRADVDEAEVRESVVVEFADLTEDLFAGDVTGMISQLLTTRDVKGSDLDRLRSLIDAKERELKGEEKT